MCHMTQDRCVLLEYKGLTPPQKVEIANGAFYDTTGTGKVKLQTLVRGDWVPCMLNEVLYMPILKGNFFSVRAGTAWGVEVLD